MLNMNDVHWLAGLFEGEASAIMRRNRAPHRARWTPRPIIALEMCDRDVVERARGVLGHTGSVIVTPPRPRRRETYRIHVENGRAIAWMMTLYPLLGERRRQQIRAIVQEWRTITRPPVLDETRRRIGVANRGRRLSDETRARMSAAQMGHVVSVETRRKIAAAQMARRQ